LPPYTTVHVATVHFEYDNNPEDVIEVAAELAAIQQIFRNYAFTVRDIAIPKIDNDAAEEYLVEQIQTLYQGLSAPGSLAIIVYGGHGSQDGQWVGHVMFPPFPEKCKLIMYSDNIEYRIPEIRWWTGDASCEMSSYQ
jgi:hypothetical protein